MPIRYEEPTIEVRDDRPGLEETIERPWASQKSRLNCWRNDATILG